jgi:hypothetical protein
MISMLGGRSPGPSGRRIIGLRFSAVARFTLTRSSPHRWLLAHAQGTDIALSSVSAS